MEKSEQPQFGLRLLYVVTLGAVIILTLISCASGGESEGTYGRSFAGAVTIDGTAPQEGEVELRSASGPIASGAITNGAFAFNAQVPIGESDFILVITTAGLSSPSTIPFTVTNLDPNSIVSLTITIQSGSGIIEVEEVPVPATSTPTAVPAQPTATPAPQSTATPVPPTATTAPGETPQPSPTSTPTADKTPAPSPTATQTPSSGTEDCAGDINGDGFLNDADLNIIVGALGTDITSPNFVPAADLVRDNVINQSDLGLFISLQQANGGVCP